MMSLPAASEHLGNLCVSWRHQVLDPDVTKRAATSAKMTWHIPTSTSQKAPKKLQKKHDSIKGLNVKPLPVLPSFI